jgi:chromosome segregation ATPase
MSERINSVTVGEACDQIEASGQKISMDKVKGILGGSLRDIAPVYKDVMESRRRPLLTITDERAKQYLRMVEEIVLDRTKDVEKVLGDERERYENDAKAFRKDQDDKAEEIATLMKKIEALEANVRQLEIDKAAANQTKEAAQADAAAANAVKATLEAKIEAVENKLAESLNELTSVKAQLETTSKNEAELVGKLKGINESNETNQEIIKLRAELAELKSAPKPAALGRRTSKKEPELQV